VNINVNCNNNKYLFLNFKLLLKPSNIVLLAKYHLVEINQTPKN